MISCDTKRATIPSFSGRMESTYTSSRETLYPKLVNFAGGVFEEDVGENARVDGGG